MFIGWLSFAGTEIANAARLMAYRNALLPTLDLKDCGDCATFAEAMGDDPYTTPLADDAEWADPDRPESLGFLGFLPTSFSGFTDSTREAGVTQSLLDGGTVGRTRRGTRDMRVAGWLIGTSEAAAEAGFSWLKAALDGASCADCEPGDDLCFLLACPTDTVEAESYTRHIRRVTCTSGPTRIMERSLSGCGGFMINVEFGFTAGSPYVYSEPIVVAVAEGAELTAVVPGSLVFPMAKPLSPCLATPSINGSGAILRDPDCPPLPFPPTVPSLSSSCSPARFNPSGYTQTPDADGRYIATAAPYEANPHIANDGTNFLVVYSSSPTEQPNAGSVVKGRKGLGLGSLGSEFTVYNEGNAFRGSEPMGLRWVQSKGKFILGVRDFNLTESYTSFNRYTGRFLTSSDGTTWTVVSHMADAARAAGLGYFSLTHIAHHDNGTTNGIIYAVGYGRVGTSTEAVLIMRSTDFGASWQYLRSPFLASYPAYYYPRITVWPDGEIFITSTEKTTSESVVGFRSTDGGSTWTGPTRIVSNASGPASPVIADDDVLYLFYRDLTDRGSRGFGHPRYSVSYDHGRTWGPALKMPWYSDVPLDADWVTTGGGGEQGQDATALSDGTLSMVMGLDFSATYGNVYGGNFTRLQQYQTYAMYVPGEILKTWQDGVINMQVRTGGTPVRQMRVTLLPRPLDDQLPEDLDPCSNCGSFVIDYAPANTIVYIDGMTERVTMAVGTGAPLPADHLISGTDGGLFSWPLLTCGTGYYVIVDVDVDALTSLALGVVNRE